MGQLIKIVCLGVAIFLILLGLVSLFGKIWDVGIMSLVCGLLTLLHWTIIFF